MLPSLKYMNLLFLPFHLIISTFRISDTPKRCKSILYIITIQKSIQVPAAISLGLTGMIGIKVLYGFSDPQPTGHKKLQMFTNKREGEGGEAEEGQMIEIQKTEEKFKKKGPDTKPIFNKC